MGNSNKNLKKTKNKRVIYIFFVTFFLSMFIVGLVIKALSPDVDVEIGDGDNAGQTQDSQPDVPAGNVDNRLKWIQFEDSMPGASNHLPADQTQDQNAQNTQDSQQNSAMDAAKSMADKIDKFKKQTSVNPQYNSSSSTQSAPTLRPQHYGAPSPTSSDVARSSRSSYSPVRNTKVYVGYYSSIDQAISVQNRLIDSDINASPFVKEVNGYYVVQVGSYANRQRAQSLYSEVSSMGLPAKLISE